MVFIHNELTSLSDWGELWDQFYWMMFERRTGFKSALQKVGTRLSDNCSPTVVCVDSTVRTVNTFNKIGKLFPETWPSEMRASWLVSQGDSSSREKREMFGSYVVIFETGKWQSTNSDTVFVDIGISTKEGFLWFLFCAYMKRRDVLCPVFMLESRFPESDEKKTKTWITTGKWIPTLSFNQSEFSEPRFFPTPEIGNIDGKDVYFLRSRIQLE